MININGEVWRVFLVSPNHPLLMRSNETYALGCCDNYLKSIYINELVNEYYLQKVLCHELVHACMFSYQIELNEQQEEVLADLIATYGQEIVRITNSIFNRLKDTYKRES